MYLAAPLTVQLDDNLLLLRQERYHLGWVVKLLVSNALPAAQLHQTRAVMAVSLPE